MRALFLCCLFAAIALAFTHCTKTDEQFDNIGTPRTNPVPDELVGRWAIVGISGSTVYNIPSGTTYNTNEYFLGYEIKKDGTVKEDGYLATYQYGVSTWAKWTGYGSVEIDGSNISFHRARGAYTTSRNSSSKAFGSDEVYPNKTSTYAGFEIGTDSRGQRALLLTHADGTTVAYVKQ